MKRRIEELENILCQVNPLHTPPLKKKKYLDMSSLLTAFPTQYSGSLPQISPPTSPLNSSLESVSDSTTETKTPPREDSDPVLPGLTTLPADYNNLNSKNFTTDSIHSPYIYGSRLRPPHTHRKFHILRQARSPETPPGTYVKRFIHYSHISNQPEFMDTDMLYTPSSYDTVLNDPMHPDTPPSVYRPTSRQSLFTDPPSENILLSNQTYPNENQFTFKSKRNILPNEPPITSIQPQ